MSFPTCIYIISGDSFLTDARKRLVLGGPKMAAGISNVWPEWRSGEYILRLYRSCVIVAYLGSLVVLVRLPPGPDSGACHWAATEHRSKENDESYV